MTLRDNTDVLRMLRDYDDLINRNYFEPSSNVTRNSSTSSALRLISNDSSNVIQRKANLTGVATHLNFSDLSSSQGSSSDISFSKVVSMPSSLTCSTEKAILKRKLLEKEAELQHAKTALNAVEPSNKRICIELESEVERYKQLYEQGKERMDTLRCQLKFLMGQETELRHQLNESRQQLGTSKAEYDLQLKSWQKKCEKIKNDQEEVLTEKDNSVRELKAEVSRLHSELLLAKQHAEQSKELVQSLKQQIQEKNRSIGLPENLQKCLEQSQKRVKELEDEIEDNKETALIARTIRSEFDKIPELRKENSQLKEENRILQETNGNVMLLQEKVWSLQEHVKRVESKNSSLAKLQVENEELQERLAQWVSLAGENASSRSPAAFSKRLSLMQKNEVLLTEKMGKVNAENKVLQALKENLEKEIQSLRMTLQQTTQNASDKDALLKRLQRKLLLISKERDSCRRVIESYENEVTINAATMNSVQALQNINADYKRSLEKLEEELEEKQKELDSLHKRQTSSTCTTHIEEIEKLNKQKNMQEAEMQQLQAENNVLHQRIQDLSQQKGNEQEKIIHLRCNPFEQAVQKRAAEFQHLKEENKQLKSRVKILEEAGPSVEDITVQVQKQQPQVSIEDVKEQLLASEKKNERLMDAFRKSSHELRDVCYRMTGYKITRPSQKKYKLSHMYAESPNDYLLFELATDDSLELLETDYSRCLGNLIDIYLRKGDSIPAFLSTLTLELFNRQTCVLGQLETRGSYLL